MNGLREFLQTIFDTAKEALRQLELAVPDYWDGTVAAAARAALLAMALFAAVLLIQLLILLFAKKKDLKKILTFTGTLAALLILYVWASKPLSKAAGELSPAWGMPGESAAVQADAQIDARSGMPPDAQTNVQAGMPPDA